MMRQLAGSVALVALGFATSGCGLVYAVKANGASGSIEEARVLGAAETAQYEYYMAKEHLLKAQEEAAQANYGDAIKFADVAEEKAQEAISLARDTHREAGR